MILMQVLKFITIRSVLIASCMLNVTIIMKLKLKYYENKPIFNIYYMCVCVCTYTLIYTVGHCSYNYIISMLISPSIIGRGFGSFFSL